MRLYVYCHTNKKTGKRYIGWTHKSMERRWKEHCKQARSNGRYYFHNAIRKWGESDDVWDHELLDIVTTIEGVKRAEILWIAQRRTYAYDAGNLGYNETRGGDGVVGLKMSENTKRRMSASHKGKTKSAEHREKIRQATLLRYADPVERQKTSTSLMRPEVRKLMSENGKGKNLGLVRSEEIRRKISDGHKRRHLNKKSLKDTITDAHTDVSK